MTRSTVLNRCVLTGIASAVTLLFVPSAATAAINEAAAKALADQARFWMTRGRTDLAVEAWKKLLAADPNNVDALAGLAKQEIDSNRMETGKAYAERLKKLSPISPATKRVESALTFKSYDSQKLAEAREASRVGKVDEALKIYRQLFGNKPPPNDLALEYYSIMSNTDENWEEARQGLARMHQQDPEDRLIAMQYARHLTYRAATRREGVQLLSKLVKQKPNDSEASDSWKQALTWMEPTKADIPLFQSYLSIKGNDPVIRGRIQTINNPGYGTKSGSVATYQPNPKSLALMEGFHAMNSGALDEAAAQFEKVLSSHPDDPDALGALGVIRQKQERLDEAVKLLEQAHRLSNRTKWGEALRSATFWQTARQGLAALEADKLDEAIPLLERAQKIDPSNPVVTQAMADVAAKQGRYADAERGYRNILRREPNSLNAIQGLIGVLAQQGQTDQAAAMLDKLTDDQRDQMGGFGYLKAEQLRKAAEGYASQGQTARAVQTLEDALLWDPANPWLRLELARQYQASGAAREARAVVDGLLVSNPNMPAALYSSALMSADSQDWSRALNQLERIPQATRTPDMAALQQRIWLRAQMDRVTQLHQAGQTPAALQVLRQAEPVVGKEPDLVAALAQGYASVQQDSRALVLMRSVMRQTSKPDVGLSIQYAGILLRTKQDAELGALLRQLYATPLTDEQRQGLDQIRVGYALNQFDALREANQLAAAYNVLMPLYQERPDDLSVQYALGRLYSSAGEHKEALAWFDHALQRDPANLDGLLSAAGSALMISNLSYAESALNNARQLAPDNAQVLAGLGRLYRAQGKSQLATQFLQRALQAEQQKAQSSLSLSQPSNVGIAGASALYPPRAAAAATASPDNQGRASNPIIAPPPNRGAPRIFVRPGDQVSRATPAAVNDAVAPVESWPITSPQARVVPVQYIYPSGNDTLPPRPTNPRTATAPAAPLGSSATPPVSPAQVNAQGLLLIPAPGTSVRPTSPLSATPLPSAQVPESRQLASLREEVADLKESNSASVAAGVQTRYRKGVPGLSRLAEVSAPMEVRMSPGYSGQFVVRATPVVLDTGQLTRSDMTTAQQFGTNALDSVNTLSATNARQSARGLALGVGYETLNLKLDLGTTPLGFRIVNVVGGAAYSSRINDVSGLRLELSRRPITDSLLSYAGTLDDRTGLAWGGVTATGGRADLYLDQGNYGGYGYAGMQFIAGKNVQNNARAEAGIGAFYKPIRDPDNEVSVGVGLAGIGYSKNLRYYTFGHGGYFSPQRYLALNFPVEWSGRSGQLSFKLDGSVGIQSFRESSAPYFPTSAALQGNWDAAAAAANSSGSSTTWQTAYPGMSKTGYGYRFGGMAEYRLAPQWSIGGRLSFDNAANYSNSSGFVYMRYSFEPATRPVAFPPTPLRLYPAS